ncbi:Crp/Fnr family transcriptional regulator [Pedobacter zeae]|uniref:CRP-like cAMP-binding protein n=1 Tax=Pedobacter zeae TaxID=1737356 RepID=A0A7W6P4E0_9SPHI|nr:Crp/Fnr family transcriptional regulator [Pedobacter zeae]MBB4106673.1 CRP-like cAMP-binding protein [Pedobacter zeae]GGH03063.1 hypothetical protein GCM10007422_17880 [Pedobacter zeae]
MENESYFKKIGVYLSTSYALRCYLGYIQEEHVFKKKQVINVSDRYFSTLLFVGTGTLRLYAVKNEEEATILFWQKGQFIPPMHTLGQDTQKEIYIEFLEETTLIGYSEKHTTNLYKLFPEFQELISKLYQQQVTELIMHAQSLAHLNASGRFNALMKSKPALFNLCELKIIANYLGIHPKVLSRLRAEAVKK